MSNINYIASAGTGKTYSLITEVLTKIKNENVSLKNMLILTFTEKAASELKEKLSKRIKEQLKSEEVPKKEKIKLHKELIYIDSGYIGTFHSIFFRFLKKYPQISKIDSSFSVLSSQLDYFLDVIFEKWIENDFKENEKEWEKLVEIFGEEFKKLKGIFIALYKDRLKLKKNLIDFKLQEENIEKLAIDLQNSLNSIFEEYKGIFDKLGINSNIFKLNPFLIQKLLTQKRYTDLSEGKNIFLKRTSNRMSEKEKDFYNEKIKLILKNENFLHLEKKITSKLTELKLEELDYNANLLLKKIFDFIDFTGKIKEDERILDFNDILEKTLNMIEENENVKNEIKNSFKYIFVDEFQDTDKIQTQIIEKISNENIYTFGDPKQCIYTWRDADLDVYFEFLEKNQFKDVVLNINYRSGKNLVKLFNKFLSEGIILEYFDKKFKEEVKANKKDNGKIKLIQLNTGVSDRNSKVVEEARYTVFLINHLLEEGFEYQDILILFRTNNHLKKFKEVLTFHNIPVSVPEGDNIFESPEIRVLVNILKFIEFPKRKLEFFKILKSPLIYFEDKQLYEKRENLSLESLKLKNLDVIKKLIDNKYNLTVENIIDEIYLKTDLLETFSLTDGNGEILENLKKFKILAKQKTLEGMSLRDFILFVETAEVQEAQIFSENSVQLLTMHKSKGLESKAVILPLTALEPYQLKLKNIHTYKGEIILNFSKAKTKNLEKSEEKIKKEIKQEWERLFYVAITRAKNELIFIDNGGKTPHSFNNYVNKLIEISNLIEVEEVNSENITVKPIDKKENVKSEDIKKELKNLKGKEEKRNEIYERAIKDKRFWSVSEIIKEEYKTEGAEFDFSKEIKENISIYIGTVVHNVMEKLDFKNLSIEKIKNLIDEEKGIIPENIREKVLKDSYDILKNLENSALHLELKKADILFRELPFVLYENDKYIEGRIDVIYKKDNKITVMDYKTNRYKTEKDKKEIFEKYKKQKEYYLKAVKKIFPDEKVEFKLGLLWKMEII